MTVDEAMIEVEGELGFLDESDWRVEGLEIEREGRRVRVTGRIERLSDAFYDMCDAAIDGALRLREHGFDRMMHAGAWTSMRLVPDGSLSEPLTRWVLPEHAHCIAKSPDGSKLAVACSKGWAVQVVLMDAETGAIEHVWTAREGESMGRYRYYDAAEHSAVVGFSTDGTKVFAAGMSDLVRGWDVVTGHEVLRHRLEREPHMCAIGNDHAYVALPKARELLVVSLLDGSTSMKRLDLYGTLTSLRAHSGALMAADGSELVIDEHVVSCSLRYARFDATRVAGITERGRNAKLEAYDRDGERLCSVPLPFARHVVLAGDQLFGISHESVVRVDLSTGEAAPLLELDPTQEIDGDCVWLGDRLLLGVGTAIFEVSTGAPSLPRPTHLDAAELAPGGARVLVVSRGDRRAWALLDAQRKHLATIEADGCSFSPDGSVVVASERKRVVLYDARDGSRLGEVPFPEEHAYSAVLVSDQHIAAIGQHAFVMSLSGEVVCASEGDRIHGRDGRIAIRSRDGGWRIVELDGSDTPERTIQTEGIVTIVDEGWIVAAESTQCFDLNGGLRWSLPIAFPSVAVSPDGACVVLTTSELTVVDARKGEVLHAAAPFPYRYAAVATARGALAFGPNGIARFGEAASVETVSSDALRTALTDAAAQRESEANAPLAETEAWSTTHAELSPRAHDAAIALFARAREIYDDDPEHDVRVRTAERVWRLHDDRASVEDASGEELGSIPLPNGVEIVFAPDGRFAATMLDGMVRWSMRQADPADITAEMAEVAGSLCIYDDTATELGTIVAQTTGEGIELRDPVFVGDVVVVEARTHDAQVLEAWNARTQTLLWTLADVDACVAGEQVAVLTEGRVRFVDIQSGETKAEREIELDWPRMTHIGDGRLALTHDGTLIVLDTQLQEVTRANVPAQGGSLSTDGSEWIEGARRWRLSDGTPLHDHDGSLRVLEVVGPHVLSSDGMELIVRRSDGGRVALRTRVDDARIALVGEHLALADRGVLSVVHIESGLAWSRKMDVRAVAGRGTTLFTAEPGIVRTWDLESKRAVASFEIDLDEVSGMSASNGHVAIWDHAALELWTCEGERCSRIQAELYDAHVVISDAGVFVPNGDRAAVYDFEGNVAWQGGYERSAAFLRSGMLVCGDELALIEGATRHAIAKRVDRIAVDGDTAALATHEGIEIWHLPTLLRKLVG